MVYPSRLRLHCITHDLMNQIQGSVVTDEKHCPLLLSTLCRLRPGWTQWLSNSCAQHIMDALPLHRVLKQPSCTPHIYNRITHWSKASLNLCTLRLMIPNEETLFCTDHAATALACFPKNHSRLCEMIPTQEAVFCMDQPCCVYVCSFFGCVSVVSSWCLGCVLKQLACQ